MRLQFFNIHSHMKAELSSEKGRVKREKWGAGWISSWVEETK